MKLATLQFLACFYCLLLSLTSWATGSAVVLQYHHVSEDTPRSTSVSPAELESHIHWLQQNHFSIRSLPDILDQLQASEPSLNKHVVAISFDDANLSVCEQAWPILEKYNVPFTLFINTDPIERNFDSQCSWKSLQAMHNSGLMTVGNHSKQHLHMLERSPMQSEKEWLMTMRKEIVEAQQTLDKQFGPSPKLFAYPYGEFNQALKKLVKALGYIGFGQQSGAIGQNSDFAALPRFPASAQFANLDTLSVKLFSLPFPGKELSLQDNPLEPESAVNPPTLSIQLDKHLPNPINCFNAQGEAIAHKLHENRLEVSAETRLPSGRHRYTCTSLSNEPGRYYWLSHQWLVN